MKKLTAIEYQKDRKENKYLIEIEAQRERDLQDSRTCQTDLKNSCPACHIIRSAFEIGKGICDNCGYTKCLAV